MIYDCFTFFNELDLLEIRMELLNKYVDYFVIGEANLTMTGKPKPWIFEANKDRFSKFKDKIINVQVTDMPLGKCGAWGMEYHQRNALKRGLNNLNGLDIVMMSDVDEIPKMKDVNIKQMTLFRNEWCTYYANRSKGKWPGTIAGTWCDLKYYSMQDLRNMRAALPNVIQDGGWHFSWFGSPDEIVCKIESFSETVCDTIENKDKERLKKCMETDDDFLRLGILKPYTGYPDIFNQDKFKRYLK